MGTNNINSHNCQTPVSSSILFTKKVDLIAYWMTGWVDIKIANSWQLSLSFQLINGFLEIRNVVILKHKK